MALNCILCADNPQEDNPILKCEKCDLSVHALCYGINDFDDFVCAPCLSNVSVDQIQCEICHRGNNAMKKTTSEKWAHVICALFTNGAEFVSKDAMEPIDITNVIQLKKKNVCVFCNGGFGTLKCCSNKCKKIVHPSCSLEHDCVQELLNDNDSITFLGFCLEHKPNEKSKRLSSDNIKFAKFSKQRKNAAAKKNADWITKKVNGM